MAAVKMLLRLFSYVFHGLLALFLLALSSLALASGAPNLQLGMLPWSGMTLVWVLFFGALFGLATIVLAILGRVRFLFFLWALAVLGLMLKGYFLSGYRFTSGEASRALYMVLAAAISVVGAWVQMFRAGVVKARY